MRVKSNKRKIIRKKKQILGFTLVELLVSVTILAIITGMSLPLIRNTIADNKQNKYETYEKTIIESAKLYTDSYAEDLFPLNKKSGCKIVKYSDMAAKGLIKDININNETCSNDDTYVRITKINDEYTYDLSVKCTVRGTNKEVYGNIDSTLVCGTEEGTDGPKITLNPTKKPDNPIENESKDKNVNIKVNSSFGIMGDAAIYYGWSTSNTEASVTDWKKEVLSTTGSQKPDWEKQLTVSTTKLNSGTYYLHVRTVDENGNSSIKDATGVGCKDRNIVGGPYIIDRDPPLLNEGTVTNDGGFAGQKKIKFVQNDARDAVNGANILVCLSENSNGCTDFKTPANAKLTLNKPYDGSAVGVYVTLKDKAGNEKVYPVNYKMYEECQTANLEMTTLKSQGTCNKSCGGGTRTDIYNTKDKNTSVACPNNTLSKTGVTCNSRECCGANKVISSYGAWGSCDKSCGGGNKYRDINYVSKWDSAISCGTVKNGDSTTCNTQICDTTPPACPTITSTVGPNVWTKNNITFNFTFSGDTTKWKWYTDTKTSRGAAWIGWSDWGENAPTTRSKNISGEGYRRVRVQVFDAVGNSQYCGDTPVYNIDKTKPKMVSLNKTNPGCKAPAVDWRTATFSDNLSGLSRNNTYYIIGATSELTNKFSPATPDGSLTGAEGFCSAQNVGYVNYKLCDLANNCVTDTLTW